MDQVEQIRRHALKYVNSLRIFISMLPEREEQALPRLYGAQGVKTAAAIADFILVQLGHCPPEMSDQSPTVRLARRIMPTAAAMPEDYGAESNATAAGTAPSDDRRRRVRTP